MRKKATNGIETNVQTANDNTIDDIAVALKEAMLEIDENSIIDDLGCDDFISTGNFAVNYAITGRPITGGFPVGRVTEVFGGEASGKTLLSSMALNETQRRFLSFSFGCREVPPARKSKILKICFRGLQGGISPHPNPNIKKTPRRAPGGFSSHVPRSIILK